MTESHVQTVLIVDSSIRDRSQFKGFLGSRDRQAYAFVEAETAQAALHLCKSQRLDCVLVSSQLSDGHRLNFLHAVKADPALKKLPVVMMLCEQERPEVSQKALVEGALDCIYKDARIEEQLVRATHNAMQMAEMNRLVTQETTLRARAEATLQKRGLPVPVVGVHRAPRGLLFLFDPSGNLAGSNQAASRWLKLQHRAPGAPDPQIKPFSLDPPAELSQVLHQCMQEGSANASGMLRRHEARPVAATFLFDRIDREGPGGTQIAVTLTEQPQATLKPDKQDFAQVDVALQADLLMARAHAAVEALAEVLGGERALSGAPRDSVGAVHSLLERLPTALLAR